MIGVLFFIEVFALNKKKLRNSLIVQLNNQSKKDRKRTEQNLTDHLLQSELWNKSKTVGITISQAIEWDTRSIIQEAWNQGKTVCVPKSYPADRKLLFYKITSFEQLEIAYYSLQEPIPEKTQQMKNVQIDLLIVPGLVFDKFGYRIGFGGGYYDRFLTDYPNETCSLLWTEQLVDQLPSEPHDIPVNYLITEIGVQKSKVKKSF